jgi:hypothetical protein
MKYFVFMEFKVIATVLQKECQSRCLLSSTIVTGGVANIVTSYPVVVQVQQSELILLGRSDL